MAARDPRICVARMQFSGAALQGSYPPPDRTEKALFRWDDWAVSRAPLIAALALTVGGVLGGCSEGPSISARVSGPTNGATVSDVRCVKENGDVTVTGTVTRNTVGRHGLNLVTYAGLKVFVYDSAGRQIGSTPQRFGTVDIDTNGQVQRFHLAVSVRGIPAVCDLDWNAGFHPGVRGRQA